MGLSLHGARQVARIKTTFKFRSCSIAARAVVMQFRIERNFGIGLQIAGGRGELKWLAMMCLFAHAAEPQANC